MCFFYIGYYQISREALDNNIMHPCYPASLPRRLYRNSLGVVQALRLCYHATAETLREGTNRCSVPFGRVVCVQDRT